MGFDYASKIRALIARAEHPNTPEAEANQARAMAEELMGKWRVSEEDALAVDPTTLLPTELRISMNIHSYDISHNYPIMVGVIATHTGVMVATKIAYLADGWVMNVVAIGYESDLRYFELLLTASHLMFSTKIDVRWDDTLSEAENIFRMRAAGFKRKEIADRAWGDRAGDLAANRSKVQRIYLRESKNRGEDALAAGLDFNSANYRSAYAEAFVGTLRRRLREARDAADSKAGLPELKGRAERVEEAFYARFPKRRPTEVTPYVDPRAECERCKAAASGYCRTHGYLKPRTWTQRDEIAWQRKQYGAASRAGRSAGQSAAEGVIVTRGHDRENRVARETRSIEG